MNDGNDFGFGGRYHEIFKHQRELANLIKNLGGPALELQGLKAALQSQSELGLHLKNVSEIARLNVGSVKALDAIADPVWMKALRETAFNVNRQTGEMFASRKLILESMVIDSLTFSQSLKANQQALATLMSGSRLSLQLANLNGRFASDLAAIKGAVDQAWRLESISPRASADIEFKSNLLTAAEHVMEAHRLIDYVSRSQTPAEFVTYFAALVSLMAALFSQFGENTVKELQGIGAVRLIELFMLLVAIVHFATPAETSHGDSEIVATMKIEIKALRDNLTKITEANEAANESYVANLPRAELARTAPIRRDPKRISPILQHGDAGMSLAIKQKHGRWYLVVYRDPLSNQLSEGWAYSSAVQLIDKKIK